MNDNMETLHRRMTKGYGLTAKRRAIRLSAAVAVAAALMAPACLHAQVGQHRDDLAVGFNAGYVLNTVGFSPRVSQNQHGGITAGLSARYVCEKYFSSICSVMAEVNYASLGWKEKILDAQDQPVVNDATGLEEAYSRTINYLQVPVFAHLGWGREQRGLQFFFQAGPQFGLYLNESTKKNFELAEANLAQRSNKTIAQDTMAVQRKFDYGIAAGLGLEYSMPRVGHFLLEGRYYYGLGNIYDATKRDYFGKSNHGSIVVKLTWLFDLRRTKGGF